MKELQIKVEYQPERCEVCHQSDCYDSSTNTCSRCSSSVIQFSKDFYKVQNSKGKYEKTGLNKYLSQFVRRLHHALEPFGSIGIFVEVVLLTILGILLVLAPTITAFLIILPACYYFLGAVGLWIEILLMFYISFRLWIYIQDSF